MPPTPSRSRPRFLRWAAALKWTGAVLCVVIFVAWFGSRWYRADLLFRHRSWGTGVDVRQGVIDLFLIDDPRAAAAPPEWLTSRFVRISAYQAQWLWLPRHNHIVVGVGSGGIDSTRVPLYIPFTLVAIPTVWLFRRERRSAIARAGLCPGCGYDLAGAPSPTCPECGKTA